eukprot:scaffold148_cov341-Pavlova_lutheri.AAC.51
MERTSAWEFGIEDARLPKNAWLYMRGFSTHCPHEKQSRFMQSRRGERFHATSRLCSSLCPNFYLPTKRG